MSVSGLSTNSPDLYTIMQNLSSQTNNDPTASTDSTSGSGGVTDPSTDGTQQAGSTQQHHHGHHHGVPKQIESAVTNALQNAPAGSDPNQVIKSAIQTALSQAQGGQDATDGSGNQTATVSDGSSNGSDATSATGNFNQLLQSYGVDPKQFGQDFQSAVQDVNQTGSVDFAKLFQSFPPGSSVDTVG